MALFPPIDQDTLEAKALLAPLRNDLSIGIYNHLNPFSVGAIIRVAHSFLVREIFIIGTEPYYEKASMGMHRYETIHNVRDVEEFFARVASRPVWAVEKDCATVSLFSVESYPRDVVFVFGSEKVGLPASILTRAHQVIGIPMYGVNHSFPVSVTSGIVLCDWARRRYAPGAVVTGPQVDRPGTLSTSRHCTRSGNP